MLNIDIQTLPVAAAVGTQPVGADIPGVIVGTGTGGVQSAEINTIKVLDLAEYEELQDEGAISDMCLYLIRG